MSVEIAVEVQGPEREDNQSVLDSISLGKRIVTGELKIVESKTLDNTIASFCYVNDLSFNVQLVVNLSVNACPEALTDFFTMCNIFMERAVQNLAFFLQGEET
jgi:hypothetical protein